MNKIFSPDHVDQLNTSYDATSPNGAGVYNPSQTFLFNMISHLVTGGNVIVTLWPFGDWFNFTSYDLPFVSLDQSCLLWYYSHYHICVSFSLLQTIITREGVPLHVGLYVTYIINQMNIFLLSNHLKGKCLSEFIMLTKLYAFIHVSFRWAHIWIHALR